MSYAPRCKNCEREHFNFVSCEIAAEKAKKLVAQHIMQPGSVPWGAGFSYYSRPPAERTTPLKLGGVKFPKKEGS